MTYKIYNIKTKLNIPLKRFQCKLLDIKLYDKRLLRDSDVKTVHLSADRVTLTCGGKMIRIFNFPDS